MEDIGTEKKMARKLCVARLGFMTFFSAAANIRGK